MTKSRNVLILEDLKKGMKPNEAAEKYEITAKRIRQIQKNATNGNKKLEKIADEDLALYVLGKETRRAINKAAGKKITTNEEFKTWATKVIGDKTNIHEAAEEISKQKGFNNRQNAAQLIQYVVRLCEKLGLVTREHFGK